jgi:uncharacterized protein
MHRARAEIAVMAKAPIPGLAKTRLIPVLGPAGAARLQERFIAATVETALAAGDVTVWAAPDTAHAMFRQLPPQVRLACQLGSDLGARMHAAVAAARAPVVVIGTDCPALTADHLRTAIDLLHDGLDAVVAPAEDGGYVLMGLNRPVPALFQGIAWSTVSVMAETRCRLARQGLSWREPFRLWDVDLPEDLDRMRAARLGHLLAA